MKEHIIEVKFCKYCDEMLEDPTGRQEYCDSVCRNKFNWKKNKAAGTRTYKKPKPIPNEYLVRGNISGEKGGFVWR